MTAISMRFPCDSPTALPAPADAAESRRWPGLLGAGGLSLVLHGVLFLLLAWNGSGVPAKPPVQPVLIAQLVALQPLPQTTPQSTPVTPISAQPPMPEPLATPPPKPLEDATLSRQRMDDQRRADLQRQQEQQRQREQAQRMQQEKRHQERLERERLAQQQAAIAEAEQARRAAEQWAANNHDYAPLDKPAPDYPQRALDRGIEGDCTVQYTVNAAGRVENPAVVGDCHPLFIRTSLNAAKAFRYQPRRVDGQPQAVANVRNTFHYRIEDQRR